MSVNNMVMAAAGVVTTVGAGWIAKLDVASNADAGYGIAVDTTGNVYVTGQANSTTATAAYVFIAKYDTTGAIQWQRSLDTASVTDISYGIAVDGSGNVYVTGQANTTTAAYVFIAKYNTSGAIQWQRSLDTASVTDSSRGIAVDGSGNVYVTGQANATTATAAYVFIAKYDTTGVIQWQRKLDTASVADIGRGIAVDSSGNVYVTGQANTTTASYVFIAKYDTTGAIQWQRKLDTASVSDIGYAIAVDGSGNVYVTGQAITGSLAHAFIAKYDTTGAIQWQRKLDTINISSDTGYGIAVDTTGSIYVTGQANATTAAYIFTAKLPADGTIPGTGTYVVGGSTLTYSAATMVDSAASLVDAAGTLTSSVLSASHWIVSLDVASNADAGYGIAVDGSGNVYVTGQANATTATAAYVFIAKYNSAGTIQWQRSLDNAGTSDYGYGIAVDGSGNVYVTGQANASTSTAAYVFIAKYDTTGVIQWQVVLDNSGVTDAGYGIAVDGSGNVYVTGSANTGTAGYIFIAKYDTTGVIQWQRTLDTALIADIGYGIAVDGSGNVYVTGQANGSVATTSYVYIAKYNTSGVIQWQRSLDTASLSDTGYGIAVDGSGNVYVTGQANGSSSVSYCFIAKYDTTGAIQWQRSLDTASVYDTGRGIAVDGSGNVYVTGQANTSTASYVFIAKYDTTGVIQWQRKLDTASNVDYGYAIAVDGSGNVYVTGQANTGANASVFIAKLMADGAILPGTSTLTYAAATMVDSAATMFSDDPSLVWIATLDTASVADVGRGIAVDLSGNVYVTGQANTSTASYVFIAKYDTTGVIQWQRKLDTASNVDYGYGIAVDGSGNVYVTGQANATTATASYVFIAKYNTSGVIQLQRKLDSTTAVADTSLGIAVDSSGNVYVTGQANTSTASYVFIAKYDTTGVIQWQRSLDTASLSDTGYGIAVDGSGNVYVTGQANTSTSDVCVFIVKYDTTGVIQWQRSLDTTLIQDVGYGIAVDGSGNVYVTGFAKITTTQYVFIAKYDTTGVIQWQRSLDTASVADVGRGIAVDLSGNVYVTGQANTSTASYVFIAKYDTTGAIQWQRKLDTASVADIGYGIAVDASGNVYVTGQGGGAGYVFIAKLPGSGLVGAGTATLSYAVSTIPEAAATLTEAAGTMTDSEATMTDSAATIPESASTMTSTTNSMAMTDSAGSMGNVKVSDYWITTLDTSGVDDTSYGIAVDGSGNVYVTGQAKANATPATAAYVFIAKYNSAGVIQWQRSLGTDNQPDIGYGIAVDGSGNVYVTGQANYTNTLASYVFIAKYNSAGVIQWQRNLDTSGVSDIGYGIAVDGSGNVYITGQANTTTASYVFIAKYDTGGVIQWQRKLDTSGVSDIGYGIAVDGSGNVYVTGQANTTTASYVFIAKYNSAGVIQWQRTLNSPSAGEDIGYGIAVDGSGNVYVTGQGKTTTNAHVFIAKYNTSGVIQWQRKLDNSSIDFGVGIAVDGSGNVYVTGQTASPSTGIASVFIVKLPANGVIMQQISTTPLTLSAATFDEGLGAMVDSAASMVDSTASMIDSAASMSSTIYPFGMTDTAATMTSTTTLLGIPDAAASLATGDATLSPTTLTL